MRNALYAIGGLLVGVIASVAWQARTPAPEPQATEAHRAPTAGTPAEPTRAPTARTQGTGAFVMLKSDRHWDDTEGKREIGRVCGRNERGAEAGTMVGGGKEGTGALGFIRCDGPQTETRE